MADVYMLFGILLALAISFPGLLITVWLLFPKRVNRSHERLKITPWRCLWLGLVVALVTGIPIIILFVLPSSPAKLMGGIGLTMVLAISTLGAAGLTARMACRLSGHLNVDVKGVRAFIGSAVALELAAFFPFVGWIVVIPLGFIFSLGAATFAIFQWVPKPIIPPEPGREIAPDAQSV
jgi:hypothetical protein